MKFIRLSSLFAAPLIALVVIIAAGATGAGSAYAANTGAVEIGPEIELEQVNRNIIAFYDSKYSPTVKYSPLHEFVELPLNHLGYVLDYVDVRDAEALKKLENSKNRYAATLVWFPSGGKIANESAFVSALATLQKGGAKTLMFGNLGLSAEFMDNPESLKKLNAVLAKIGVRMNDAWVGLTYKASVSYQNDSIIGFESALPEVLPPYFHTQVISGVGESHLTVKFEEGETRLTSDLVVGSPNGLYIADRYAAIFEDKEGTIRKSWIVNPFAILDVVLQTEASPIPDVTTLNGRRIFYSHIDGDGWNNLTEIEEYRNKGVLSSEVVKKDIFEKYQDIVFDVGIITGEIDPECYGYDKSLEVARAIINLPNVFPTSHSHTHPLYWDFFKDNHPEKEKPYLGNYPPRPSGGGSILDRLFGKNTFEDWSKENASGEYPQLKKDQKDSVENNEKDPEGLFKRGYSTPRTYACGLFDINKEISGSVQYINELSNGRERVDLFQWSGNTSPFPEALKLTRKLGLRNINGGDSRFDPEYPSFAWVSPIGLRIDGNTQIYSSNSNENTYTNDWQERYFGFKFVKSTADNTDRAYRVKPFNVYFHMFSGQKQASLNAVQGNIEYALSHDIIPIRARDYAAIADGFYSTKITKISPDVWELSNRDELSTVRFDKSTLKTVDYKRSRGVLGHRHLKGSLYVSLDPAVKSAKIALKEKQSLVQDFVSAPALIESRWKVENIKRGKSSFIADVTGYGAGEMKWRMPEGVSEVEVELSFEGVVTHKSKQKVNKNGILELILPKNKGNHQQLSVKLFDL